MSGLATIPSAIKLREKFERNVCRRRRLRATWDHMLSLYRNPHLSGDDIAWLLDIEPATARNYAKTYFRPFTDRTGYSRFRRVTEHANDLLARTLPKDRVLGPVAEAADNAGLRVRRVAYKGVGHGLQRKSLEIEGQRCRVHFMKHAFRRSPDSDRLYVSPHFLKKDLLSYDAHILHVSVRGLLRRIFVIPSYVLKRLTCNRRLISACLPVEPYPIYRRKPKIDWYQYEVKNNEDWIRQFGEDQ